MLEQSVFSNYCMVPMSWDEMCDGSQVRPPYQQVFETLNQLSAGSLNDKDRLASELFMSQGITFTVYSDNEGIERIFPFDIIPRIIPGNEWDQIEAGITQRLKALNLFLRDIYTDQQILKDGIIPAELIASCPHYTREVFGIRVPHDIFVHIAGIDLIRGQDGSYYVLEDNLRTPSGVSYMLENREVTKRIFPEMLTSNKVRMVNNYPLELYNVLVSLAPRQIAHPTVVLLTPGVFNSAYYEHTF
ncbi:MAG: circularly permuted type 2 ATP-grasp protein, partial [Flavihumibacter sp.]|nr:circularly permuted type 2 ATP-grasp protein [Flavihumibacter sp.]